MKGDSIDDVKLQKFSELKKSSNHMWYELLQTHYAENHKHLKFQFLCLTMVPRVRLPLYADCLSFPFFHVCPLSF